MLYEVITFAADTSALSRLDEIPAHMTQIQGALQMLSEERALQLAEAVSARIEELRSGELVATQALLDALAVCVGTLTAYAEGLQHGRPNIRITSYNVCYTKLLRRRLVTSVGGMHCGNQVVKSFSLASRSPWGLLTIRTPWLSANSSR